MISTITSAYRGIQTAAAGFEKAATEVMKATAPDSSGDLPGAIAGTKTSEIALKANVAVFKVADKMMGELVDTIA